MEYLPYLSPRGHQAIMSSPEDTARMVSELVSDLATGRIGPSVALDEARRVVASELDTGWCGAGGQLVETLRPPAAMLETLALIGTHSRLRHQRACDRLSSRWWYADAPGAGPGIKLTTPRLIVIQCDHCLRTRQLTSIEITTGPTIGLIPSPDGQCRYCPDCAHRSRLNLTTLN